MEKADDNKNDDGIAELHLSHKDSVIAENDLSARTLCRNSSELVDRLENEIKPLQKLDRLILPSNPSIGFHERITLNGDGVANLVRPGPNLPGYELLEELGRGGMGVVYKARQQSLNRYVAIKTLSGNRWSQPGFVNRLKQEAIALSRLNHSHVVGVFDVVETHDSLSLVLEFVEGENLAKRLKGMPIPAKEAARIGLIMAQTLSVVHSQGLLHRDLKPANVLVDGEGRIKIADFGLAKQLGTTDGQSVTGELYGSPSYMAPEQANGKKDDLGVWTDVYGIGATLYEMLTGRPPFVGASTIEVVKQVLDRDPVGIRVLNPEIPRDLETICMKCLEKKPSRRYGSASELAEELNRYLNGIPIHSRQISVFRKLVHRCQRHPGAAGLIGISTVACIAIASILVVNNAIHRRDLAKHNRELKSLNDELSVSVRQAEQLREIAEANERRANDGLYASDMSRAAIALKMDDTRDVTDLLNRHIPKPGEVDRRGFEWWYLRRQTNIPGSVLQETGASIYTLVKAPNQRTLAAAGKDGIIRLFNIETGKLEREISTGQIEVNGLTFLNDGQELASSGDDGTIRIWNLQNGQQRLLIKTLYVKVYEISYLAVRNELLACGNGPFVCSFDPATGHENYRLEGHQSNVNNLAIAEGGHFLASASNDGTVKLWNLETRTEIESLSRPENVEHLIFSPGNRFLVTGNSVGLLQTYDLLGKRDVSSAKHLDRIAALRFHPDGKTLLVGDMSGRIRIWSFDEAGELLDSGFAPWQAHNGKVGAMSWAFDQTRLISAGKDGRVISWNFAEAQRPKRRRFSTRDFKGSWPFSETKSTTLPRQMPVHDSLALGWNSNVRLPAVPAERIYSQFSLSKGGQLLAAQRTDGAVELFEFKRDRDIELQRIATRDGKQSRGILGFALDSSLLVVVEPGPEDGIIQGEHSLWTLRIPQLDHPRLIPIPKFKYAAIAPNQQQIAVGSLDQLILWDFARNERVWTSPTPQPSIRQIVYSSDGALIATVHANRSVIVWNANDGTIQIQFTDNRSPIQEILFSPDNKTLVTATEGQTIRFCHLATGQELMELPNIGRVTRMEFSEDGNRLICQISRFGGADTPDEIEIFDANPVTEVPATDAGILGTR